MRLWSGMINVLRCHLLNTSGIIIESGSRIQQERAMENIVPFFVGVLGNVESEVS